LLRNFKKDRVERVKEEGKEQKVGDKDDGTKKKLTKN
jgi:hypothetical protein